MSNFGVQEGAEQNPMLEQSASVAQVERHVVPAGSHAYTSHEVVCSAGHAPAPSQLAAAVTVALVQPPVRHDLLELGYTHACRSVPPQMPPQVVPCPAHGV
jgi:hypothetical protein